MKTICHNIRGFLGSAALAALVAAWSLAGSRSGLPFPRHEEAEVKRETFRRTISCRGELRAKDVSVVLPRVSGELTELVEDGAHVEKGEVVARLDNRRDQDYLVSNKLRTQARQEQLAGVRHGLERTRRTLEKDVEKACLELDLARAELEALRARPLPHESELARLAMEAAELRRQAAQRRYEREQVLFKKKLSRESKVAGLRLRVKGAETACERARLDYEILVRGTPPDELLEAEKQVARAETYLKQARDNLKIQVELGEASVAVSEAQLRRHLTRTRQSENRVANSVVRAPRSGTAFLRTIWKRPLVGRVAVGDHVWGGNAIVDIVKASRMLADSQVNEVDWRRMKVGQRVLVRLEAVPEKRFTGKVTRIGAIAQDRDLLRQGSTRRESAEVTVFEFTVEIDEADPDLRPTMTAHLDVIWDEEPDVLLIPRSAVVGEGGRTCVWRRNGDQFTAAPVTLGPRGKTRVVVLSGLQEGDTIAVPLK